MQDYAPRLTQSANLGAFVRAPLEELKRGVTVAVAGGTAGLKQALRRQVDAAGLGTRLGNAIGSATYPQGNRASLRAAGTIFPRGAQVERIFTAFNEGATIRPTGQGTASWLALPTDNVPPLGGSQRISPAAVEAYYGRSLRYVAPPSGRGRFAFLVMDFVVKAKRAGRTGRYRTASRGRLAQGRRREDAVAMFVLVPQVTLRQRLDFRRLAEDWAARIPDLIARELSGG